MSDPFAKAPEGSTKKKEALAWRSKFLEIANEQNYKLKSDKEVAEELKKNGLSVLYVTWSDVGRSKNPPMGTKIPDMHFFAMFPSQVGKDEEYKSLSPEHFVPFPAIRTPNFSDEVHIEKGGARGLELKVRDVNGRLRITTLDLFLKHIGKFIGDLGEETRWNDPVDCTVPLAVAHQFSILPLPPGSSSKGIGKKIDIGIAAFGYQGISGWQHGITTYRYRSVEKDDGFSDRVYDSDEEGLQLARVKLGDDLGPAQEADMVPDGAKRKKGTAVRVTKMFYSVAEDGKVTQERLHRFMQQMSFRKRDKNLMKGSLVTGEGDWHGGEVPIKLEPLPSDPDVLKHIIYQWPVKNCDSNGKISFQWPKGEGAKEAKDSKEAEKREASLRKVFGPGKIVRKRLIMHVFTQSKQADLLLVAVFGCQRARGGGIRVALVTPPRIAPSHPRPPPDATSAFVDECSNNVFGLSADILKMGDGDEMELSEVGSGGIVARRRGNQLLFSRAAVQSE
eukprot:jgi/Bigna1/89812/estExt_fgenesh1_pg.C_560026